METLELIKTFASTTNNVWLQNKLELLELEFKSELTKERIKTITELTKLL